MTISGKTILIVEDEPIIGMTLEGMLEDLGARSILAESLEAGLAAIEQGGPIDAAILDVNLRGVESYPVAYALAQRRVPFIFASGYGDVTHPEAFSATPTVDKPYRLARIEAVLSSILEDSD